MEPDQYLQMILSVFIVIVLVLVFIFYTQGSRTTNINRRVIVGPGGQQWTHTLPFHRQPVIVNPPQQWLGPGGTQWIFTQ